MITNIVIATITAYCHCTICCGPNAKGITANGNKPIQGITVAASRSIPFGTTILWSGKNYKVHDRLAKRFDNRIDVYYERHQDAKKFGIKYKQKVTIITK